MFSPRKTHVSLGGPTITIGAFMPPRFPAIAASRGRLLFMPPDRRLEWTKTTQALTARGALQKTPESIVVTLKGRYWARWASRSLERHLDLRT